MNARSKPEAKAKPRTPDKERQRTSRERRAREGGVAIGGMLSPEGAENLGWIMESQSIPTKMGVIEYALKVAAKKRRSRK